MLSSSHPTSSTDTASHCAGAAPRQSRLMMQGLEAILVRQTNGIIKPFAAERD
jgi:hypothetical protein